MNITKKEAIEQANACTKNAGLPTYSKLLDILKEVEYNYVIISKQEGRITKWCFNQVSEIIIKANDSK